MKRLITFGCSFTDYSWPTWADIIALDREVEYENWAVGGGGNQQIARRALYRHTRGFEEGDWVMIQWSGINREDRFKKDRWIAEGSVLNSPTYRGEFVKKYWDWNNDVINTAHSRITTELLLGDRLKYQMKMQAYDGPISAVTDDTRITDWWHRHTKKIDVVPSNAQPFNGQSRDGHPDPQWWLNWVETKIYPWFGWQLRDHTRHRVQQVQRYLESLIHEGRTHSEVQHLGNIFCNQHGWQFQKVKPGSNTLNPGFGSDVLM